MYSFQEDIVSTRIYLIKKMLSVYLQEGNGKDLIDMIFRFDEIIRDIVNGIKKGVDLFKQIISGEGIKGIINKLVAALESLPEKVTDQGL